MKIYIAGPIKGFPDRNLAAFRFREQEVKALGHDPVIPHDLTPREHPGPCPKGYDSFDGHSSACYLKSDIAELLRCDAIQLLDLWQRSKGATFEHKVASMCGLHIFYPRAPLRIEDF